MHPNRSYIISSTMRSGSTMLASGLRETGIAGRPEEFFTPPVKLPQAQVFGMDPAAYRRSLLKHRSETPTRQLIEKILEKGTTPNGVFAAKIQYQSPFSDYHNAVELLQELHGCRTAPTHQLFEMTFPNLTFVWLQRRDRVAQAVSLFKAVKTSEFVRIEGTRGGAVSGPLCSEDFDFTAIQRFASWLQSGEEGWHAFFKRSRIQPLVVVYEDLVAAYEETIKSILIFLKLPTQDVSIKQTRHEKQADDLSQEWISRFNAMSGREQ